MTQPAPISAVLSSILRERYPQPHRIRLITAALLRQEAHDMLPDLNRIALPTLKNGVHPPLQFTVLVQITEPELPLDLEQLRRSV